MTHVSHFDYRKSCGAAPYLSTLIVLVLLAAGCEQGPAQEDAAQERPPTPVEVAEVKAETVSETVQAVGSLQAIEMVEIVPEVAGRIEEINFVEGETVEEGDVLFKLDDDKLRSDLNAREASLNSAQASLDLAQQQYDRVETLRERQSVSQEEFDESRAAVRQALAEIQRLQAEIALVTEQLSDTTIHAPFSGAMSDRLVDRGDFVSVGQHMATLYTLDPIELQFSVPERFSSRLEKAQPVTVKVDAYPLRVFKGNVQFISPAVRETTRDILVKANILNPKLYLKPGMYANVQVTTKVRADQPVIPEEALVSTRGGYLVFVAEDGVAHERTVEVGVRSPGEAEIVEGVAVGELVVTTGHMNLIDGAPLRITHADEFAAAEGDGVAAKADSE